MKMLNIVAVFVFVAALAVFGSATAGLSFEKDVQQNEPTKTCSGEGSCNGECGGECGNPDCGCAKKSVERTNQCSGEDSCQGQCGGSCGAKSCGCSK